MRNSSLQLQGPCYPIIFPSVNVYWSCQYIARKMGGVNIQDDVIIDKSIRRSLDSRASVVKRYVADIGKSWPELTHVCGVAILMTFISVIAILTSVAIIHRMYYHGNISPQAAKVIGEVATVITGSVASYYWAGGEASPEIPFLPVFASMKRLAR
ncbi:hypothetical protein Bca4012_090676 [Brassica carinata]|uniref:Uncharacterized protein n=1 Tax=Brassica carinata TaxID=52824 RepID=A0A8X7TLR6_BRACI|nr:hypothetical protein Bca52824_085972 [Brassica carinata]